MTDRESVWNEGKNSGWWSAVAGNGSGDPHLLSQHQLPLSAHHQSSLLAAAHQPGYNLLHQTNLIAAHQPNIFGQSNSQQLLNYKLAASNLQSFQSPLSPASSTDSARGFDYTINSMINNQRGYDEGEQYLSKLQENYRNELFGMKEKSDSARSQEYKSSAGYKSMSEDYERRFKPYGKSDLGEMTQQELFRKQQEWWMQQHSPSSQSPHHNHRNNSPQTILNTPLPSPHGSSPPNYNTPLASPQPSSPPSHKQKHFRIGTPTPLLTPGPSPAPPMSPMLKLSAKKMPRGKNDNKPRGRMTAYAFFVQTCREEHKKKHPDENVVFAEFSKKCAERWKTMLDKEKRRFHEMAEKDKLRYDSEMQNYVPSKTEKRGKKRKHIKDPNAPKRSLSAFFWFCNDERPKVKAINPEYGVGDVAKELGRRWAEADPDTKSKYEAMAEKDKARYDREMTAYKKKPKSSADDDEDDELEEDEDDDDDE